MTEPEPPKKGLLEMGGLVQQTDLLCYDKTTNAQQGEFYRYIKTQTRRTEELVFETPVNQQP